MSGAYLLIADASRRPVILGVEIARILLAANTGRSARARKGTIQRV
jgi:hypothetical protein